MMALVVPGAGGRDVTRAKKFMSAFMRGQGRVPLSPMPRRVVVSLLVVDEAVRIGVVATIRVRGRLWGMGVVVGGGIVVEVLLLFWRVGG